MIDLGAWDYVIVGAGTAGCLLANRLSADPGNRVLLLEAGKSDAYPWIHIPVGYLYCIGNPRTDWMFQTDPEPGLNGRAIRYPRGKVLGGCSSINGMIYMRGQAADYDGWRQMGCTGWGWDDVLPYFLAHEHHHGGNADLHRGDGEWRVAPPRVTWELLDAFRDAAEQAGIPKTADFNTGDNEGSAYFEVNQKAGFRWNTASAFLKPTRGRPNLRIETEAMVTRIRFDGRQAVGLDLTLGGQPATIAVDGEVILSAGAIGTPHLLQRSGVGPADVLASISTEPVLVHEGVGRNLSDHLQLRTVWKVANAKTLNQTSATLWGKAGIALEYLLTRRGPMSMAPSQVGVFARSNPDVATPNLQFHVQPLSLPAFGEPLHDFPAMTASICNLRPTSRGEVVATAPDADVPPAIRPNYLSTPDDRAVAAEAIRLARQIMAQPAMNPYSPAEYLPGPDLVTDADLEQAAGDIGTTIFHPVGTCRMGVDPDAVVDPALRLNGIGGVRIVDASVMPTITSGNTNSPTLMIAEKAAEMILDDARNGTSRKQHLDAVV